MVGTGKAAELGVLIGGGEALEQARRLTTVVLDKTGTVTRGEPSVAAVRPTAGGDARELLALAAAAEVGSEHPLGEAIVAHARAQGLALRPLGGFEAIPGHGLRAHVSDLEVLVGNAALMERHGVPTGPLTADAAEEARNGATPMYVAVDGQALGIISVADAIKVESPDAVTQLRALGLEVWMLTGDNGVTAAAVAQQAGIDRVLADVRPEEKSAKIAELQAQGQVVAMVGDGINDAPALAQADLGIAIGTGTDVAIAASDITLVGGDLRGIVSAIALSRRTVSTIKQGLFWAFAYNVLLIPVAAGVLYPSTGILLDPVLAAAAMAMSSVSVVTNALRLRSFRRPSSVAEILRPRLATRVTGYAYLVGVAAVAVAVGAGLTALSRSDAAQRGMNGQLAWVQGTGMPMRPPMRVMMAAETEPADAEDAGIEVSLEVPLDVVPGRPTTVTVRVADADTGAPLRDVGRSHESWMHLIATRDDLGTFAHAHPEPGGTAGEFAVELTFPSPGRYLVHTELRRRGAITGLLERHEVVVGDPATVVPQELVPTSREQKVGGVRVSLEGDVEVGRESELTFVFADAITGAPTDDLEPYLAAAGHVVVMPADTSSFAHEHAEVEDAEGRPVFALPGQRFGPELDFHFRFPAAGLYQLWGQFQLADGTVLTVPFTVEAG
jgi:P-type Cu+ transporter